MKRIKIDDDHAGEIAVALYDVNGNAATYTVDTYAEIRVIADRFAKRLRPVPVRDRARATYTFRPAGPSSKAYKNSAISTEVTLAIGGDGKTAYLVDVARATVYGGSVEAVRASLRPDAHARFVEACAKSFGIVAVDAVVEARARRDRDARLGRARDVMDADHAILAAI